MARPNGRDVGDAQGLQEDVDADISDIETTESEYSGMDSDEIQYLLNNLVSLMDTCETMKNVLIDFVYKLYTLLNVANGIIKVSINIIMPRQIVKPVKEEILPQLLQKDLVD